MGKTHNRVHRRYSALYTQTNIKVVFAFVGIECPTGWTYNNATRKCYDLSNKRTALWTSESRSREGTIHDSLDEAIASVNKMKADSGHGVSTRIVLLNETPGSLFFTGSEDYKGNFGVRPPVEVSN